MDSRSPVASAHPLTLSGLTLLALISIYIAGADIQLTLGKNAEDVVQAIGIAMAVIGLLGRFLVSGARATNQPFRTAVLYRRALADLAIVLGLAVNTQVWWFAAAVAAGYAGWFAWKMPRRAATAPSGSAGQGATGAFSWSAALRAEYGTVYLILAFVVLFEVAVDLRTGHATAASWPADWKFYFGMLAAATLLAPLVRIATAPASTGAPSGPATRGLRVDGRANFVDLLENLISAGRQEAILRATLDASGVSAGDHVVDVGCGTGKLAVAAAERVGVTGRAMGIDATPAMIDLAIERAGSAESRAIFRVGVAEVLPLPDSSQHAVTSSYFFHHLPSDLKRAALREMLRVLVPGGRLVITDYGRPRSMLGRIACIPMRFDFHEYVRPQLAGELETVIAEAGFGEPELVASFLGYINVLRIVKPSTQ